MDDRSWIEKLIGVVIRDSNEGYPKVRNLPTRAFSWLKTATTTFTFKTLLRHYAKRALTPRSLNVKLDPRHHHHDHRQVLLRGHARVLAEVEGGAGGHRHGDILGPARLWRIHR